MDDRVGEWKEKERGTEAIRNLHSSPSIVLIIIILLTAHKILVSHVVRFESYGRL